MDMSITGWAGKRSRGHGGGVAFQEGTDNTSYMLVCLGQGRG